jgi:transcriptional regulator with XRE-family HTH domain
MDLAEFLAVQLRTKSYRELETDLQVSRGSLEKIVRRQNKNLPRIETLERIALYYGKELWEVMQMAGVRLGLPQSNIERAKRLDQLVTRKPALNGLIERLYNRIDTDPGYVDGMIVGLEASLSQHGD